jgi:hypothetical protein
MKAKKAWSKRRVTELRSAQLRKLIVLLLLLSGCSGPNLFFPSTFWRDDHARQRFARFTSHWNNVLARPALRNSIRTVGGGVLNIAGVTVLRVSNSDCPGFGIQERFQLWQTMKLMFEAGSFQEARFREQSRQGAPVAWLLKQRRRRELFLFGPQQREFDLLWGLYSAAGSTWTPDWHTLAERARLLRQPIEINGWLWKLVPCEPQILVIREGRVPAGGFLCGLPPNIRASVPGLDRSIDALLAPRTAAERTALLETLLTEEEALMIPALAQAMGRALGLHERERNNPQ